MSKGPLALRTISEAADILGVPQHVLRFWETKFTFIRPTKRAGGRRFYRPQDIDLLTGVKTLLYDRGYTIRGAQKLFKDEGQKAILGASHLQPLAGEAEYADKAAGPAGESLPQGSESAAEGRFAADTQARPMGDDMRARFLEIARQLEEAQATLGRRIGRETKGGKFSAN